MARSIECKCETGRFTCGHCLQNAKPYFFTLASGERIYDIPVQKYVNTIDALMPLPKGVV